VCHVVSRDLDLCVPDASTKDLLGALTVPLLRISIIQLQLVLTHFEQVGRSSSPEAQAGSC
jgi:hypothetical protein